MAKKKESAPKPIRSIHVLEYEESGIDIKTEGAWNWADVISAIRTGEMLLWIKYIDKAVDQRMGHTQQMKEVLDMVKGDRDDGARVGEG